MNLKNNRYEFSCSNYHDGGGVMNLEDAKITLSQKFPLSDVNISIIEVCDDGSRTLVAKRENGIWQDCNLPFNQ